MTDRPPHDPPPVDEPTRAITLPPLPGRPPPSLPAQWAGRPAPDVDPVPGHPVEDDPAEDHPAVTEERRATARRTDEIVRPPAAAARERTLAFSSPEMRNRPIEPVSVRSNPRRWPWVVLTLLPVLVILGFGIAWLVLLLGG